MEELGDCGAKQDSEPAAEELRVEGGGLGCIIAFGMAFTS